MAIGDKKAVVMENDRGVANGVATLGADLLLAPAQRPRAGGLYRDDGETTLEASFEEIDVTLADKAPAGQGYDGASSAMPRLYLSSGTETEFEALLDAKLATMTVGSAIQAVIYDPSIMSGFSGTGTLSLESNYSGGFATLTCNFVTPSGVAEVERQATIIKVKTRSVWQPWEWVNPPMRLGVEYRTTERYNGKPVYAKIVSFGALPQNSYKNLEHGVENVDLMLSCQSTLYDDSGSSNTIPFYQTSITGNAIEVFATRTVIRAVTNYEINQLNKMYCLLKYTKTTD